MLKKSSTTKSTFVYALLAATGIAGIFWVSNEAVTNPEFQGLIKINATSSGVEVVIDRRPHVNEKH